MQPARSKQRQGLRALAESLAPLTATLAGKSGFATARLRAEWAAIAGTHLAERSRPERIIAPRGGRGGGNSGGILVIRVASGAFALELQHQEPLICERINGFFGWPAVARLRFVHGLPKPPSAPPSPPPAVADRTIVDAAVTDIDDPALEAVLRALASRVLARAPSKD
jgi:hypothetical protein